MIGFWIDDGRNYATGFGVSVGPFQAFISADQSGDGQ